jgi:hypothetical protein
MTTASRIRQPAATHVPAPAVALLAAGCSVHDQPAHHTATDQPAGGRTAASTSSPAAGGHSSTPDLAAARAWAIAANSSCYLDPSPGAWTVRARPLTTRPETRAEVAQRTGGGEISRMQSRPTSA